MKKGSPRVAIALRSAESMIEAEADALKVWAFYRAQIVVVILNLETDVGRPSEIWAFIL